MTVLGKTDFHQDSEYENIHREIDKVDACGYRGSEIFIFLHIYFICMGVLPTFMSVYQLPAIYMEARRGCWNWSSITGGYELSGGNWESSVGSLDRYS